MTSVSQEASDQIHCELEAHLILLAKALPERFHFSLRRVIQQLPLLFVTDYPLVINHLELAEMNIHVSLATGGITGIVDWHNASLGPFGLSLWGLETFLGIESHDGWHFYCHQRWLRRVFWDTFFATTGWLSDVNREAIKIARVAGLFCAFGLNGGAPVEEGDLSLQLLDAFLSVELGMTK